MFIFNTHLLQKSFTRKLIFLGVSLFVSVLLSLLLVSSSQAKMSTDTPPSERAASYSYWKAMSKCVRDHMRSTIHTKTGANGDTEPKRGGGGGLESTKDGEWFDDLDAWVTVYPDGKQDCAQLTKKALKLWGWTDNKQFLKDMGFSFDSTIPAWVRKNDDGSKRFEGFKSAVLSKVGNVVDLLDNSAKYALYMGIFTSKKEGLSSCSAKQVGLLGSVDKTQSDAAKNNQYRDGVDYTILKVVEGTEPKEYVYTYSKSQTESSGTTGGSVTNYASTWNYRGANYATAQFAESFKCADLVSKINSAAPYFRDWNLKHQDKQDVVKDGNTDASGSCTTEDCEATNKSSCVVEGVGWIVCPVLNFTAGIVDAAYGFVSNLLTVQPIMTTGETKGVYDAWEIMRNIANAAFVIAFLIIIFSQLTGMGVSNYGVKKMLPRLVISAILVNLSFWVCAIAVDISNILGASIMQLFDSIGASLPGKENVVIADSGEGWAGIVGAVLAGGAVAGGLYIVGLAALIPALLAAVVAIVTVFLVLTLRQALIILLIVIAPLAFVAFLLPNTEGWFTKWRKILMTLLLMYPIIAGIFGASALASVIVMSSSDDTVIQIMGACIAIIPLAITPVVMKTAGGVLNRFAGMVNNPNRGPVDRLRKAGEKYRDGRNNLRNTRALEGANQLGRGAFVRWRTRRGEVNNRRQQEANRASTEYIAGKVESSAGFRNSVAGGTLGRPASDDAAQRALASSISAQSKLESEELSAANIVLKNARLNQDQNRAIAAGGVVEVANPDGSKIAFNGGTSTAIRSAAIQNAVASNDVAAMNSLWNDAKSWEGRQGDQLREVFADSLQSSGARPAYMSQGAIAGLRTNDHANIKSTIEAALGNNTYSPEKIASADKDELNIVAQVLKENHDLAASGQTPRVSDDQRQKVLINAEQALTDPRIKTAVGKNLEQIQNIVGFKEPTPDKKVPIEGILDIHRNQNRNT